MITNVQFSLLMTMLPLLVSGAPTLAPISNAVNSTTLEETVTTTRSPLVYNQTGLSIEASQSENELQEVINQFVIDSEQSVASTTHRANNGEQTTTTTPIVETASQDGDGSNAAGESEPSDREECPICYEPFGDEEVKTTKCSHKFHKKCIDNWEVAKDRAINCPMCRAPLDNPEITTTTTTERPDRFQCQGCFQELNAYRHYTRLSCGHGFHFDCLKRVYRQVTELQASNAIDIYLPT